jgi:hypothetical protein
LPALSCFPESFSGRANWIKRWMLVGLIALALAAVILFVGFTQIKLDALQEPGHLETVFATQAKHLLGSLEQSRRYPPSTGESTGEHRGREQTLRHRLFDVSRPRRPHPHGLRSVDVSARFGSHIVYGATILRSRTILDCKKWNSSERNAGLWKSRIRRAYLGFGALCKNSPGERPSG